MAKKFLRDDLVGHHVLVNTDQGDAFEGILWAIDDTGMKIVGTGKQAVRLHTDGGKTVLEMPWAFVPDSQIAFVTEPA